MHSLFFEPNDESDVIDIHGICICRMKGLDMSMLISEGGGGFALLSK